MPSIFASPSVPRGDAGVKLVDLMAADGVEFKKKGRQVDVLCPFHDDHKESMSVNADKDLYYCHTCGASGGTYKWLVERRGLSPADAMKIVGEDRRRSSKDPETGVTVWESLPEDIEAAYEFRFAGGELAFVEVRHPKGATFYDGTKIPKGLAYFPFKGGWVCGSRKSGFEGPKPLYNLPKILANPDKQVWVVEGAKCADAAIGHGALATAWHGGAGNFGKTDLSPLFGRRVLLIPDADKPGRASMEKLARILHENGCSVRIASQEGDSKEDVADWLEEYGAEKTGQKIRAMARDWKPPAKPAAKPSERGESRRAFHHTAAGLEEALETLGIEMRYDVRGNCLFWKLPGGDEWIKTSDNLEGYIMAKLLPEAFDSLKLHMSEDDNPGEQKRKGYRLSRRDWDEFGWAMAWQRQYDGFKDYLDSLPAWDGIPRIDSILKTLFECDDTPMARFGSSMPLLQAARYVTHPGFKCDEALLIWGLTGTGKSSAYQLALPEHLRREGYTDKPDLRMDGKMLGECLEGAVFAELAEVAMNMQDTAMAKRFLTSREDGGFRPAFGRRKQSRPRMAAFIATADKRECMSSDPAMIRRFVPVEVRFRMTYPEMVAWWTENREQAWAEAVERAAPGDPYMPPELRAEQTETAASMSMNRTPLHDLIDQRAPELNGYSAYDISRVLDIKYDAKDFRLINALKDCGFVKLKPVKLRDGARRVQYNPWGQKGWNPAGHVFKIYDPMNQAPPADYKQEAEPKPPEPESGDLNWDAEFEDDDGNTPF